MVKRSRKCDVADVETTPRFETTFTQDTLELMPLLSEGFHVQGLTDCTELLVDVPQRGHSRTQLLRGTIRHVQKFRHLRRELTMQERMLRQFLKSHDDKALGLSHTVVELTGGQQTNSARGLLPFGADPLLTGKPPARDDACCNSDSAQPEEEDSVGQEELKRCRIHPHGQRHHRVGDGEGNPPRTIVGEPVVHDDSATNDHHRSAVTHDLPCHEIACSQRQGNSRKNRKQHQGQQHQNPDNDIGESNRGPTAGDSEEKNNNANHGLNTLAQDHASGCEATTLHHEGMVTRFPPISKDAGYHHSPGVVHALFPAAQAGPRARSSVRVETSVGLPLKSSSCTVCQRKRRS